MENSEREQPLVLGEGTRVEVTSDEEGFRGAWYVATVAEPVLKSASKKKKKVLVKYETLVTEDGSTSLTECVDRAYIRPLPPQEESKCDFVENDVVDAGYRDGWWTGVVRKVLENSRYRVYFDNPPDVMEFERKDLRARLDWVDGKWVLPQKQQAKGSVFSSGIDVEVKLERETYCVWLPAIVIKENDEGSLLVKYEDSTSGRDTDAVRRVIVDLSHVRPTPPSVAAKDYDILEIVDAVYDFGWRMGLVTKILDNKKYTVAFEDRKITKDFDHTEIRPHMEWADGKWTTKSKVDFISPNLQKLPVAAGNSSYVSEKSLQLESTSVLDDATEKKTRSVRTRRKWDEPSTPHKDPFAVPLAKKTRLTPYGGGVTMSLRRSKLNGRNAAESQLIGTPSSLRKALNETPTKTFSSLATPKEKASRTRERMTPVFGDLAKSELSFSKTPVKKKQQQNIVADSKKADVVKGKEQSPIKSPQSPVTRKKSTTAIGTKGEINGNQNGAKEHELPIVLGLKARQLHAMVRSEISGDVTSKKTRDQNNDIHDSLGDIKREIKQQKSGGSSLKRKRGRPCKFINPNLSDAVGQEASTQKADKAYETDSKTRNIEKPAAQVPNGISEDDQPLSTWIGTNHSSGGEDLKVSAVQTVSGEDEAREKQIDIVLESPDSYNKALAEEENLPFVKKSPIWSSIESMSVFRMVPQRPHFSPLCETKEEYREGTAIGVMVTFAGLFDKIAMLQCDDPKSTFDSVLESLLDMEIHGFDVTVPRGRVNALLLLKDSKAQLSNDSREAEREIAEHTDEKTRVEQEMLEIRKKIIELELKFTAMKSQKETKDSKIATLHSRIETLNKQIQNMEGEFQRLATAPWKLLQ